MRLVSKIIVHCADTPECAYFDIEDIRRWHTQERGFSDVGYHYVILLDGSIQIGRDLETIGAHCYGHNKSSVGVCYIGGKGGDTRTKEQKESLKVLLKTLKRIYPIATIHGHRDFSDKDCPSFDATKEYKNL